MPRKPKTSKVSSLASQALAAIAQIEEIGGSIAEHSKLISDAAKMLKGGYGREVVSPTGDTLYIQDVAPDKAAMVSDKYIRLLVDLYGHAESLLNEEESTEVQFIQRPLIIPVDSAIARAHREKQELGIEYE